MAKEAAEHEQSVEQSIARNEDVRYNAELADEDDREAAARAEAADKRADAGDEETIIANGRNGANTHG